MRAKERIQKGDVVLSVPIKLTFSQENANQTELQDVIDALKLDQYVAMALMLLQEKSKGAASSYFPYVCKVASTRPKVAYMSSLSRRDLENIRLFSDRYVFQWHPADTEEL
jgi:hypothetical protein